MKKTSVLLVSVLYTVFVMYSRYGTVPHIRCIGGRAYCFITGPQLLTIRWYLKTSTDVTSVLVTIYGFGGKPF
jgi:hypothetical protein